MQIWIIDDDRDIRDALAECLAEEGHSITCFSDGSYALGQLANCLIGDRPDVILLDMLMPGMPGDAFLEALAKEVSFDGIPVVVLSAASLLRDAWPRAKAFLRKPFGIEDLLDTVSSALS